MTHIVAIANQKGGVGKTTTAVNLAASLAIAERRTLLLDADPQGNATSGLGIVKHELEISLYDALVDGRLAREVIMPVAALPHLSVLPATQDLVGAELQLVERAGRESALRKVLEQIEGDYDYVIIDCPPSLGLLTLNVLAAANAVLIPIQCEYYGLEGISQLLNTVRLVQQNFNPGLAISGVLLTMYDARLNLCRQVAEDAKEYFGAKMFLTAIPRNVRLAEAPSFGKPILLYDVQSVGAKSYIAVAQELMRRVENSAGLQTEPSPAGSGQVIAEPARSGKGESRPAQPQETKSQQGESQEAEAEESEFEETGSHETEVQPAQLRRGESPKAELNDEVGRASGVSAAMPRDGASRDGPSPDSASRPSAMSVAAAPASGSPASGSPEASSSTSDSVNSTLTADRSKRPDADPGDVNSGHAKSGDTKSSATKFGDANSGDANSGETRSDDASSSKTNSDDVRSGEASAPPVEARAAVTGEPEAGAPASRESGSLDSESPEAAAAAAKSQSNDPQEPQARGSDPQHAEPQPEIAR